MSSKPSDVTKQIKFEASTGFAHVMDAFYKELKKNTPIRTGRARSGWAKYKDTQIGTGQTQTVITNSVPYIAPLDQGSSKQAPHGIVEPSWAAANKK
jgi:hypothetical protein